jgi:uncharacterized Zn finger protein (UPF0148 family)
MSDRKCPNCGSPGVAGTNDSFACPACGGTFTFTAGEAKLTGVGELDRIKKTIAAHDADLVELKKVLPASRPGVVEPDESPDEDDRDEDDDADDEEDL